MLLSTSSRVMLKGYDAVMVNLDEIRRLVKLDKPDGIIAHEACKRLSTSHRLVKAFIDRGILPTVHALNPTNRCPMKIIPNASFSAFVDQYTLLYKLTQRTKMHHAPLAKTLEEDGVHPAFDPDLFQYFSKGIKSRPRCSIAQARYRDSIN
ncbi:MAG: hypothetical protein ACYC5H_06655 [Methylovirgula sp.]